MLLDVLVLPKRVTPRLKDLKPDEVSDLFLSVQKVGKVIERIYQAEALTISLQDGEAAGQSVPHVHIHILPRRTQTDFGNEKDDVYPALEASETELLSALKDTNERNLGEKGGEREVKIGESWNVKDEDRRPRTMEEMENEARELSRYFQQEYQP